MKLERLWPVIVHGNPELWTTGERWNTSHKSRESVVGAKKEVLGGPGIVAADKAGCLGGGGGGCLQFGAAEHS